MSGLSFAQLQALGFADKNNTLTLANKTLVSPAFTGNPTAPTPLTGDSDTSIATTAFVQREKEYLPSISQSLHIGTVVKAIVYDTGMDSDGGAWRKRCQDKSWYTEMLGGDRWIGQQASIAAAWTAAGSATGAVFQASATAGPITIGKYYSANSATTVTEVFRGVTREFPAVAGIVAESGRVVIYDLRDGAMWMVFVASGSMSWYESGAPLTSVAAADGVVFVGGSGVRPLDFVSDSYGKYITSGYGRLKNLSLRNSVGIYVMASGSGIVSNTVNDVALTVLDNAPIDPATGLPVPTIAVATAGGVSVILANGTVVNDTYNLGSGVGASHISFIGSGYQYANRVRNGETQEYFYVIRRLVIPSASTSAAPDYLYRSAASVTGASALPLMGAQGVTRLSSKAFGMVDGLVAVKENHATPTKGMVAFITDKFNSAWQIGDSRLATLADTTAEAITASGELVTNGTFDTDTTGWSTSNSTLSVVSGKLRVTAITGGVWADAVQTVALTVGKTYAIQARGTGGTATDVYAQIPGFGNFVNISAGVAITFVAAGTTLTLRIGKSSVFPSAGDYADFDNISVKLVEPDRSVKNNGLIVNGSLTKAPVAAGSKLVAYSGFSASSYLEQPYNSQLDFGTGDFFICGWFNHAPSSGVMLARYAKDGTNPEFQIRIQNGEFHFAGNEGITKLSVPSLPIGWNFGVVYRLSGVVYASFNNGNVVSVADTTNYTNTSAVLGIGVIPLLAPLYEFTSYLSLWRISATAPSADQIGHIYRTELPLFQPGAQCTIAGTSPAVTALAYDDSTDLLHVGTSWGRTSFKDLVRVDSEATTTGSITSLSAQGGTILTGGTSVKLYTPAKYLRDELQRQSEAKAALGRTPVFHDYDAIAAQVAFVLPKGFTAKAVYSAGLLKRAGSTKDYTVNTDGFQETVTFAVAPGAAVQVTIMTTRS